MLMGGTSAAGVSRIDHPARRGWIRDPYVENVAFPVRERNHPVTCRRHRSGGRVLAIAGPRNPVLIARVSVAGRRDDRAGGRNGAWAGPRDGESVNARRSWGRNSPGERQHPPFQSRGPVRGIHARAVVASWHRTGRVVLVTPHPDLESVTDRFLDVDPVRPGYPERCEKNPNENPSPRHHFHPPSRADRPTHHIVASTAWQGPVRSEQRIARDLPVR